jgi:hypothetical protein
LMGVWYEWWNEKGKVDFEIPKNARGFRYYHK